ncbi:MAG: CBS domain-containing protein [Syntrophomonadaceae bacterium]|nr:CBS domain-containing protein [Syntrophomonadaceae bacterium]
MKVKDRMNSNVKKVELDSGINEAFSIMKDNNIRRLPVMDQGKVIGIVTLSDLNRAAPSFATSLSIYELNYLLARTKIRDVMPKGQKLLTVSSETFIETAARVMRDNKVSGLPVVDDDKLVGIITETDLFDALIDILGVHAAHTRIDFIVNDRPGPIAEVTGIIAARGINITNIVVYFDEKKGQYKVILRMKESDYQPVVDEMIAHGYEIESVITRDGKE